VKLLQPGEAIDGFQVRELVHQGGMAHLYRIGYANGRPDPGFPMVMKVPRMGGGDGAENIIGFEVEQLMLQALEGPHVPRLVATGDLTRLPYLVMEYVPGRTLQQWLDAAREERRPIPPETVAQLGHALAVAAHSLHRQDAVHLDLKPANVVLRRDGQAVLLDFGLGWHAHLPDLLAEELRPAIGSPAWIAPEQVVGVRGDPRSDLFAIGVMLYELATGELPFGEPQTNGGLRQRLWLDPLPPRARRADLPEWLQEVILRCLEPQAERRYPSAAHLAFDLAHPEQVRVTGRGQRLRRSEWRTLLGRWIRAAGEHYRPSPLPSRKVHEVPIVMVAVPHEDVADGTLWSLREAAARSLGSRPGARLACVTVVSTPVGGDESALQREHLERLRRWSQGLDLQEHQVSCHVIDAGDAAQALIDYARGNHVSLLVMGAATHGLALQRLVPTVPLRVAMAAPCSVMLVKPQIPVAAPGAA
jgi:eukaryotic-like serine/threonine-protein kinase